SEDDAGGAGAPRPRRSRARFGALHGRHGRDARGSGARDQDVASSGPSPLVIQRVKQILERLGVQYAVIGAMAMAARGFPRFTLDFDFLTTDKRVLDPNVWDGLVGEGVAVIVGKWEVGAPRHRARRTA